MRYLILFFSFIVSLFIVTALCSCDDLPDSVEISDIPSYYFDNHFLEDRAKAINDAIE
jgi:hypothetical protein